MYNGYTFHKHWYKYSKKIVSAIDISSHTWQYCIRYELRAISLDTFHLF